MKTTIPFSGFYESTHRENIEQAETYLCTPPGADGDYDEVNQEVLTAFFSACDYRQVFTKYAEAYATELGEQAGIKWKFESLRSPREYNFTTDCIFCDITQKEVKRLLDAVKREDLAAMVKEQFTSRSGFSSFYDNSLDSWGDYKTWDHNQVGTLVVCYLVTAAKNVHGHDVVFDDEYLMWDMMEDYRDNGYFDRWLCEATPNADEILAPLHEGETA